MLSFFTSNESRKYPKRTTLTLANRPNVVDRNWNASDLASGVITVMARTILPRSYENFPRLSFCFSFIRQLWQHLPQLSIPPRIKASDTILFLPGGQYPIKYVMSTTKSGKKLISESAAIVKSITYPTCPLFLSSAWHGSIVDLTPFLCYPTILSTGINHSFHNNKQKLRLWW